MAEDERDAGGGGGEDEQDGGLEVALTFSYEPEGLTDDLFGVSEETLFTAFEFALEAAGIERSVEVSVLITTDEGIRALNREYRGKDEATDVLSFPLLDEPLVDAPADQLWQPDDAEQRGFDAGVSDAGVTMDAERDDADSGEETAEAAGDAAGEDGEEIEGEVDDMDGPEEWPLHLGDVAIARETVIQQAEKAGHSAAYEAAYLFVHGVLHLIGYDDHTDAGYRAMVTIQETVLAQAGVAH